MHKCLAAVSHFLAAQSRLKSQERVVVGLSVMSFLFVQSVLDTPCISLCQNLPYEANELQTYTGNVGMVAHTSHSKESCSSSNARRIVDELSVSRRAVKGYTDVS